MFWYESEIVLDENLLDRTPLNPDNAENTYKVKPLKKTHKVILRHEDDMSIQTIITLKYQTNNLEKVLLSTGETTRETFGKLSVDAITY